MKKKSIKVDQKLVKHTSNLTRINVTDDELDKYVPQLQEVISYIEILNEIDTTKVKPTYSVIDGQINVTREDKVMKSLSQQEALSQTKKKYKGYFMVRSILNEK